MKLLLLLVACALLSSCSGSGEGGSWTPADTAAAVGAVNNGMQVYDRYQNPQYYRPVQPVGVTVYP